MKNCINSVYCSINCDWIGNKKSIILTDDQEKELDEWLENNSEELFLENWDFVVGLGDTIINLFFSYVSETELMKSMNKIQKTIEEIISHKIKKEL